MFIEFCIFLCCLVSFCQYVIQEIDWEDYYSCDIFRVEGFPYKDLIELLFIVSLFLLGIGTG